MATTMTRFELQIPVQTDTTKEAAVNTFLDTIGALQPFTSNVQYTYTSHDTSVGTYIQLVYGVISISQQAAALAALNTLNTALGTPVLCISWSVSSQP